MKRKHQLVLGSNVAASYEPPQTPPETTEDFVNDPEKHMAAVVTAVNKLENKCCCSACDGDLERMLEVIRLEWLFERTLGETSGLSVEL